MATTSGSGPQSARTGQQPGVIELYEWHLFVAHPVGHRPSIHVIGIDAQSKTVRVSSAVVGTDPEAWLCRTRNRNYRLIGRPTSELRPILQRALHQWRSRHAEDVRPLDPDGALERKGLLQAAAAALVPSAPEPQRQDVLSRLLASGDLVRSADAARRLGRREEELARQTHRLFSLATPEGAAYPAFLFDDALVRSGLGEVLLALRASDPWTKWLFLTRPSAALGGATPLQALRSGRSDAAKAVVRLARAKARPRR